MTTDPDDAFADLAHAHPGREGYTPMDRYRDFRTLFLGSDLGKRVLYEILGWGHVLKPTAALAQFDASKMFYLEGKRTLALEIFEVARIEPSARPVMQNKVPKRG